MRVVTVPENMASEQKSLLGIMSYRQLVYSGIAFFSIGAYVPSVFSFLSSVSIIVALIGSVLSAIPVLAIIGPLAFLKKKKYHMFWDRYLLIKLYRSTQYGVWRKGQYAEDWMKDL